MCGIAGLLGRLTPDNRAALRRMSRALAHRGPDAEGTWESPADAQGRGVLLAHRRLAILDLSPAGAQPMVDSATGDVIVYNGEIYNYRDLQTELAAAGQTLASTGDTAAMLRLLSIRGTAAIAGLRGMFAFAHWRQADRLLTLARDPFGIKPLYYALNPEPNAEWSVLFASEVRAILESDLLASRRLDPDAVRSIVWNGFVVGPGTAVRGIRSVWPGDYLQFGDEACRQVSTTYWRPIARRDLVPAARTDLDTVLRRTVREHLASDVPLAVFLSSGVDSTSVANLAQAATDQPVHTLTLSFEEGEFDEYPIAAQIARAIGAEHHRIMLTQQNFISRLDAALDSVDQPSFDGFNNYFVSHALREAGFKVALIGNGGDELFGGYSSFHDLPILQRWQRNTAIVPTALKSQGARLMASLMGGRSSGVGAQTRWAKLPDIARAGTDMVQLYQLAYALFRPETQRRLLRPDLAEAVHDGLPSPFRTRVAQELEGLDSLESVSLLEHRLFLGERSLRDVDAMSMSASVELRLPLVDSGLYDTVSQVPSAERFAPVGQKALLRKLALRGIDPELMNRPKRGFVLPFDRWLKVELGQEIARVLEDPLLVRSTGLAPEPVAQLWRAFRDGAPGLYWTRIWALFVFVRWCHRHRVYI